MTYIRKEVLDYINDIPDTPLGKTLAIVPLEREA